MASGRQLAFGVFFSVTANLTRVGLQLAMLPLMARLLGPHEMGLYMLAMPITTFVLLLSDGGLGDSLVREKDDNSPTWSSAFWGLLGVATIMAGVAYGASFYIADIARQPRLPEIMLPLSFTIILASLCIVPNSRLLRAGRLREYPLADITGQILGAMVALYLAFNDYGVWAMVGQLLTLYVIRTTMLNLAIRFVPRWEFNLSSLAQHWGVGGSILGGRLMDLISRIGESTLVSRNFGAGALGAYGNAIQISRFASEMVSNSVWTSLYYMIIHGKGGEAKDVYVRISRLMGCILLLGASLAVPITPLIIPFLFGEEWKDSVYPLMFLLATYPFSVISTLQAAVTYNRGKSLMNLLISAGLAIGRIGGVIAGSAWGIAGVAAAVGGVYLLHFLWVAIFVSPIIGNRRRDLFGALAGPTISGISAALATHFTLSYNPTLPWMLVSILVGMVVFAIVFAVIDHRRLKSDFALIRQIMTKKNG